MHFFTQVLITANAWGAGFKYQPKPTPKNEAPTDIQTAYDALRKCLADDKENYGNAFELVKQIESALYDLNSELGKIKGIDLPANKLPDTPEKKSEAVKAAYLLLLELDCNSTWKKRVTNYG